jgi:hypothetical protein
VVCVGLEGGGRRTDRAQGWSLVTAECTNHVTRPCACPRLLGCPPPHLPPAALPTTCLLLVQTSEEKPLKAKAGKSPLCSDAVDTDDEGADGEDTPSFRDIGVCEELCRSIEELGWKKPSAIQVQSLPKALKGHDVIGLAKTGSGKTAAFAIPILQVGGVRGFPPRPYSA